MKKQRVLCTIDGVKYNAEELVTTLKSGVAIGNDIATKHTLNEFYIEFGKAVYDQSPNKFYEYEIDGFFGDVGRMTFDHYVKGVYYITHKSDFGKIRVKFEVAK